ncbi:MAG: glutamine synthetase beta-grasp domain-containing protein [Candidatus Acetothermia bacterium]|jgi:glutamine synthetase|nr:glutamine synthetase beta-grasp domain-containing protein [Candidatus Acetothermia bacterium]
MTFEELLAIIQAEDIRWVDLRAVDLAGRLRCLSLPAGELSPAVFQRGIGVDASNYGLAGVEESDMVLLPDPATARIDPTRDPPALVILCDLARPGEGPFPAAPRSVARAAEGFLQSSGIADHALFGVELEFYLFDSVQVDDLLLSQGVEIVPLEGQSSLSLEALPSPRSAYHAGGPEDRGRALRERAVEVLTRWGIPVRYHHHEGGSLGQMEIELGFGKLLEAADWTALAQDLIARLAADEGLVACFLPKPIHDQAGSGLHFHQYLAGQGRSLFAGEDGLSELALHYVGGLLVHGRALSALVSPSTNSYRRLRPGFEAPVHLAFGHANRTAAVRIPGYIDPASARIEYRPPDPSCNPYLALSACLMAGVDGIRQAIDPVAKGWGPHEGSLYERGRRGRRVSVLPRNLEEALDALRADHGFLTLGGVFPEELIELWLAAKGAEAAQVAARPHPYEFRLYGP